jgi:hypothetical protein
MALVDRGIGPDERGRGLMPINRSIGVCLKAWYSRICSSGIVLSVFFGISETRSLKHVCLFKFNPTSIQITIMKRDISLSGTVEL